MFKLSKGFLEEFRGKLPPWGPLGEITYLRTYSRVKEDGDKENWSDTVQRVVEGVYNIQFEHCARLGLPWSMDKAQRSAREMFELMWEMKFLPPGRGLWSMGSPSVKLKGGAVLNNCAFISTKDIDRDFTAPFIFMMDMSMLGVGVGFDTEGCGEVVIKGPSGNEFIYIINDTREGWCEALRSLLLAYVDGTNKWKFDYELIRPYGELIKGFGGTASGPGPLRRLLEEDIPSILDKYIGRKLDSTGIVDVMNAIGRCVVSGNVRRSAQVALGYRGDRDFLELKLPSINGERLSKWGWASNNSVVAYVGMPYDEVASYTASNGEPGYLWLSNMRAYGRMIDPPTWDDEKVEGSNPCLEQSLEDHELCCLVETFPARHASYEEYERTLKFAYLYAKTVTLVPTHNERTNAVMLRNRRIGTSMSGIVRAINKIGWAQFRGWCDTGYGYLRDLDKMYSNWLCVPKSIKITSVKPSGTVSLLPGEPPGVHYPYSQFYYRTIRFDKNSYLVQQLIAKGYKVEDDVVDKSAAVVYFPVREIDYVRGRNDVTMWEQLELAALMQAYWADNQVSVTITFKPHEAKDIGRALEIFETRLKSVSFLPLKEHRYAQAPYIEISAQEYDKALFERARHVNGHELVVDEGESEHGGQGCDGDFCKI